MTDAGATRQLDWSTRLHRLAKPFLFQGSLPDVDEAIRLACDLLVEGMDSPATTSVAALPFGTTVRDCEPLIREMLLEHGLQTPDEDSSDDERFGVMLQWFAAGHLTFGDIWGSFLRWLPAWEEQTAFQRALVRLSNELDWQTIPAARDETIGIMRTVAASPVEATNAELPLRVKVESAFSVTGRGTVLAGTIEQGTIRGGVELELVQLTDDGTIEIVPLMCKSVESIFHAGRDPALSPLIGVLVTDLEPESVKANSWLQHRALCD